MKATKELYNLDKRFECVLVTALCFRPKLYTRIGSELVPDLLNDSSSKLAMKAARAIAADKGTGSDSLVLVAQRLRRWYEEGKCTQDEIDAVMDMFDRAEELGIPSDDSIIEEIAPILKHKAREAGVHAAIENLGKHTDMISVANMFTRAERIGLSEAATMGVDIRDFMGEISSLRNMIRLPTGIVELDHALMGGPEKGSAFCFVGGPGEGKSMALSQVAAHAWIMGMNVVYATLELNKPWTLARFVANITGIPINKLLNGSMDAAFKQMKEFWENECPGIFSIEKFTPKVTTLTDIKDFVARVEDKHSDKINLIVIDYCDKLSASEATKGESEYKNMLYVFEGFRVWVEENNCWGWTASQAQRRSKDMKTIGTNHMADSQHKARVLDGIITLNKDEEDGTITLFVAKNRNGIDGIRIGPLPTDFAHGRLLYMNREEKPKIIEDLTQLDLEEGYY